MGEPTVKAERLRRSSPMTPSLNKGGFTGEDAKRPTVGAFGALSVGSNKVPIIELKNYFIYLAMTSYNYDIASTEYNDDEGYQRVVCSLFYMDYESGFNNEIIDTALNEIYALTRTNVLFKDFYIKAASFMLSENPEIGLSVLFAYDNLPLFHDVLVAFHKGELTANHPAYVILHNKLFS